MSLHVHQILDAPHIRVHTIHCDYCNDPLEAETSRAHAIFLDNVKLVRYALAEGWQNQHAEWVCPNCTAETTNHD